MVSIAFLNQAVESLHSFRAYSLRRQLLDAEKIDILRYVQDLTRLEHINVSSDQVFSLAGRVSIISTEDIDQVCKAYIKARLFMLIPEALELEKRGEGIDYFIPLIEAVHDPEGIKYLFALFNILDKSELQSICSLAVPMISSISDPFLRGHILLSIAKISVDDRENVCREVSAFCQEAVDFTGYSALIDLFAKYPKDIREMLAKICFPFCSLESRIEAKLLYLQHFISIHSLDEVRSIFSLCHDFLTMISDAQIEGKQSAKIQIDLINYVSTMNPIDRAFICPYVKKFCEKKHLDDWIHILSLFRSISAIPESHREKIVLESQLYFERFNSLYALVAFIDVFSNAAESELDDLIIFAKSYCNCFPPKENDAQSLCRFLQSTCLVDRANRFHAFNHIALLKQQGVYIDDEAKLFVILGEMQDDDAIHVCTLASKYFLRLTHINAVVRAIGNIAKEEREIFCMQSASLLSVLPPDEKTCIMLVMMSYFRPALSAQIFEKINSLDVLPFSVSFRFVSEYLKRLMDRSPELKDEFNTFFISKWACASISMGKRRALALEIIDLCRYMHFAADHPLVLAAIDHIVFNKQKIRFAPFVTVFMQNRSLIPPMQYALVRWMQSEEDSQSVIKLSLEILEHARFLHNAAALPLLKESFYQVLVKDGYSLNKLIPILGKAPNAAPIFHEVMITLLRHVTDRLSARYLARQTLSHPLHLGIDQDHDLFQEALRVMILSDQVSDKKNPYILFGFLKSMLEHPTPSVPQPTRPYKSGVIQVNFLGLKNQSQQGVCFDEMLSISKGQRFDPRILSSLSLHLLERIDALLPREKEGVYHFVKEITGFDFRFLCENLQDPLFIQILSIPSIDRVPMIQAYLHAYMAFIMSLSNERGTQDVLSEQEKALLLMSTSIQNCPTGKMEGVVLAYPLLPEQYRYGTAPHGADLPVVLEAKMYLRDLISTLMIQLCSADNAMMHEMTGVSGYINQLAHQSLYVKNLLFSHVGMEHELQFDSNAGVLYDALVMKDLKSVFQIFCQHVNPNVIIDQVKNQFDRADDEKKAHLFNGFNELTSPNIPSSLVWNISDSDGSYQLTDDGVIELLLSCNFFSFNS